MFNHIAVHLRMSVTIDTVVCASLLAHRFLGCHVDEGDLDERERDIDSG